MGLWLLLLSGCFTDLMLGVKVVAGSGGVRLPNVALGGANACCVDIAEFWVLVFGVIRGASSSARDSAAGMEKVGGFMVGSRGGGDTFTVSSTGFSLRDELIRGLLLFWR